MTSYSENGYMILLLVTQNTIVEPWFDNRGFRVITFLVSFAVKTAVKTDDSTTVEPRYLYHGSFTLASLRCQILKNVKNARIKSVKKFLTGINVSAASCFAQ